MENQKLIEEHADILDIAKDEKVLFVMNRTIPSFYVRRMIRGVYFWIGILIAYLIINAFPTNGSKLFANNIILLIITGWAVYFVVSMGIGYFFVKGHIYFITDKRLVILRKFISINFREIDYKRITDLVLTQSLMGRVFNYGSLLPVTAGVEMGIAKMSMFSLEGIKDVFKIRNMILGQIRDLQEQLYEKYAKKGQND